MPYFRQIALKIDRARIFLALMLFLYLWDVAYFVGVRNPRRLPHPFSLFRTIADIEVLRGFSAMLRELIFSFVSGALIGIALGALILYSSSVSRMIRPFLRIFLWFPLLMIFAVSEHLLMSIIAVTLCACYYYIAARSSFYPQSFDPFNYAAREALLQALLVSLIGQLFISHWQWFTFTWFMKTGPGFQAFAVLVGFIATVNWCFKSNFPIIADSHAAIINQELKSNRPNSFDPISLIYASTLLAMVSIAISLSFGSEIWGHMSLSLLEVICGLGLGSVAAQITFVLLSRSTLLTKLLFLMLPLTYISAIVLWLLMFVIWPHWAPNLFYFWHKVIAVGFVAFYPLIQSLWGLRDRPGLQRMLLAIDEALPIAFVTMFFGEAYAATQGLGFFVVVAKATQQSAQAILGCSLTLALMLGLSVLLRWTVKRLSSSEKDRLPGTLVNAEAD
jgi:ABC-type nitrate/sulfonate/bicarbonate transport system permease component